MASNKKKNAEISTVTRDIALLNVNTGNVYESLSVISKRANVIQAELKEELDAKLKDFAPQTDSLEEVLENREQIEISRFYERMPKPVSIAYQEWIENQIFFDNAATGSTSESEKEQEG
jgi:DNA-directed RNA polymerase subunit K/omega